MAKSCSVPQFIYIHSQEDNIPEFSPDGINLNVKLLPLYANEVIICKFGLFRSANSNSISLRKSGGRVGKAGGGGNTSGEYSGILLHQV